MTAADPESNPIEISALLERVEGDLDLLGELVEIFADTRGEMSAAVHAAAERGDAVGLAQAAHALKGAVSNFCAQGAVDAALQLERMGRSADLAGVEATLARLDREMDRLANALATVVADAGRR